MKFIDKKIYCDCNLPGKYNDTYDRYYCDACDIWLEGDCGCEDATCPFPKSPDKPSMVNQTGES